MKKLPLVERGSVAVGWLVLTLFCVCCLSGLLFSTGCTTLKMGGSKPKGGGTIPLSQTVVWCGLDYSMVRMIGTTDFNDPAAIFPGMLNQWNLLFAKEVIPNLGKALGRGVTTDISGMQERNAKAKADQVIRKDGPEFVDQTHISPEDIAKAVRSYQLTEKSGTGLVFVMDRLVKLQQKGKGCIYVVFFDVQTRKVLSSRRVVEPAMGMGMRNYWFGPVKAAVKNLYVP